ncbi:MAG: isochorismatase family cysteine hydrolase [Ruminococcus sp.]|nr:isochorismatase family cysteine hydrolase [Ruminococcus sp.]
MKRFLIVVDIQKDFVDGSLGTPEAVGIIENACRKIEAFNGEIIATLDTHTEDYLNTAEGKKLPVVHCVKGTDGWLLNEKVKAALDQRGFDAVEKNTFGSVDLPEIIRRKAGKEEAYIELIGLCTDICVVSNALILKAEFPESQISVDPSCCAGVTPELHNAALMTMKSCQIDVY